MLFASFVAVMPSIEHLAHRSIPWIDTTRPTLPRYPQPRAPRTAGHHGAGRDSGTGANQSPTTVSRRVCGRVQRRAPGASGQDRATLDHGQGTHYTIDRLSNTRPAPPTTGSSSMDQGVGRSVWVRVSGIRCQGACSVSCRGCGPLLLGSTRATRSCVQLLGSS